MNEGHQGQKNIQIRRRSMRITPEPATGPWQGNDHPGESIERNQPGGLDRKRELRGQDGERDWDRACR